MDKRADLALSIGVILFGAWYFYQAAQLPATNMPTIDPLTPSGLPKALGIFFVVAGLILVLRRLIRWRQSPGPLVEPEGEEDTPGHPVSLRRVAAALVAMALYLPVLPLLGFLLSAPLFVGALLAILGVRSPRQLVPVALGLPIAIYVLFSLVLRINLPLGPLETLGRF